MKRLLNRIVWQMSLCLCFLCLCNYCAFAQSDLEKAAQKLQKLQSQFENKDEFETERQYKDRKYSIQKQIDDVSSKIYSFSTLAMPSGAYDAENEIYSFNILNDRLDFSMNSTDARLFADKFKGYKVTGKGWLELGGPEHVLGKAVLFGGTKKFTSHDSPTKIRVKKIRVVAPGEYVGMSMDKTKLITLDSKEKGSTIDLWDVSTLAKIYSCDLSNVINSIRPGEEYQIQEARFVTESLVVIRVQYASPGTATSVLIIYDINEHKLVHSELGVSQALTSQQYKMVFYVKANAVHIFDALNQAPSGIDFPLTNGRVKKMAVSEDGNYLVTYCEDSEYGRDRLVLWDIHSGKIIADTIHQSLGVFDIDDLRISPNGKLLILKGPLIMGGNQLEILRIPNFDVLQKYQDVSGSVVFFPNSSYLGCPDFSSSPCHYRLFDESGKQEIGRWGDGLCGDISFSPNGKLVSAGGSIRLLPSLAVVANRGGSFVTNDIILDNFYLSQFEEVNGLETKAPPDKYLPEAQIKPEPTVRDLLTRKSWRIVTVQVDNDEQPNHPLLGTQRTYMNDGSQPFANGMGKWDLLKDNTGLISINDKGDSVEYNILRITEDTLQLKGTIKGKGFLDSDHTLELLMVHP